MINHLVNKQIPVHYAAFQLQYHFIFNKIHCAIPQISVPKVCIGNRAGTKVQIGTHCNATHTFQVAMMFKLLIPTCFFKDDESPI